MGAASYRVNMLRLAKANFPEPGGQAAVPAGCKGPACPAFAICQGRCATRSAQPRVHPDGGVWIDPIG